MQRKSHYHDDLDGNKNLSAGERHRLRRAKIEAEREERRRAEQERLREKNQKKKSQDIPAKWYLTGGVMIAGTPVRNMFYGGANMEKMVCPHIPEPSLLNPVEAVAASASEMEPLGDYPMYQYLSPEQRRGYIDFLASDRTQAKDIGFVFLYLYGFERRLILDAAKPGEVSDEERDLLIGELVRLYKTFGSKSRSLCHYIAALLLYDGRAFDILDSAELDEIFCLSSKEKVTPIKSREAGDNADALSYMLVSRLKEHKMEISSADLIAAAKGRLLRGSNASMLGITRTELYDDIFDSLISERVRYCDMMKLATASARVVSTPRRPIYYPSSPMIRKKKAPEITGAVCKDPEEMGVPLKGLSDIIVACKKDIEECQAILDTASIRDIDRVQLDALDIVSGGKEYPLNRFLHGKAGATYVPVSVLEDDMKQRFGTPLSYTSKGIMSSNSQSLISAAAATLGWQAMLPDVIEGMVPSYWRIDKNSQIVMFERGTAHNKKNGKRCIGPIFGHDEQSFSIVIPGAWNQTSCLAFVFAWFVSKCPNTLDKSYLTHYSSSHYPSYATKNGYKKNQIAFFFSLLHATYSLKLSTHGIKGCIAGAGDFADVQDVIFSLCNEVYGNMIPQEAMEAIEDIYKKADRDPGMILYDYHAGSYHVTQSSESGFVIDEGKLADTIADTSSVHSLLNEAMKHGSEEEIILDDGLGNRPEDSGDIIESNRAAIKPQEKNEESDETTCDSAVGDSDTSTEAMDIIKAFFGNEDEGQTSELLNVIIAAGLATTSAEAMGVIASVNESVGEEIVEIDGPGVYWNA